MPWDFKNYWATNKDTINKKRRKKYRENPEHRSAIRQKAKENYREGRRGEIPTDRRTIIGEDGQRFWTIGRLARLIDRKISTIRNYHKEGVIPEPKYFDTRGWRLYTPRQAGLLRTIFNRLDDPEDNKMKSLADVTNYLKDRWED